MITKGHPMSALHARCFAMACDLRQLLEELHEEPATVPVRASRMRGDTWRK